MSETSGSCEVCTKRNSPGCPDCYLGKCQEIVRKSDLTKTNHPVYVYTYDLDEQGNKTNIKMERIR